MTLLLEMSNIHKIYPNGTIANQGIDLNVYEGEIHALVGENGAGKSTLMKILFGLTEPSKGEIKLRGEKIELNGPKDAKRIGIGMVHQHFMLIPSLTVAENIVLGNEPRTGPLKLFRDQKKAIIETTHLVNQFGLMVDPNAIVQQVSVGEKQRIEILKVLYQGARIIILDEPTAVLTPQETDELFTSLKTLVKNGYTIIFITHKLREVMEISDRVTVLKSGKSIATRLTKETTKEEISRLMVGRDVLLQVEKKPAMPEKVVLNVNDLVVLGDKGDKVTNKVSFCVREGEIFGIAGVEGNGQSELIEAITGLRKSISGSISFYEHLLSNKNIAEIRQLGIGHIPEDRNLRGACLNASIADNFILDRYRHKEYQRLFFLDRNKIKSFSKQLIRDFDIRTESEEFLAGSLSGGNLQKVVIARELSKAPKLLIASQPTRGVDIGAIEFIHRKIIKQRDDGAAVLLLSAELSEVMSLSDRIGVIYKGDLVAILENDGSLTEEEIGYYMLGLKKQEKKAII